jgi:oxygen-independent coproporphyrinogen-3 oxidase
VSLAAAWEAEAKDALFLYLHVPFCEMRCGYCNLFTRARPEGDEVARYVEAIERQARRTREALGRARFARMAVGGGTPTYLGARGLASLLDLAMSLGASPERVPTSVEASPGTADIETLALLASAGVQRVSLGVESFVDAELGALGRPVKAARAHEALARVRAAGIPVLNIDLIYGIAGQTGASLTDSLRAALIHRPEEIYLYPLYVRPLTGLSRRRAGGRIGGPDDRLDLYRVGRDFLRAQGYVQESMRMFRRSSTPSPAADGPTYCCQDDGMVGLGCGARSYTRALHYGSPFAVSAPAVRDTIASYVSRPEAAFDWIDWGVRLDAGEQRRRYLIKSLLRSSGLSLDDYRARFGTDAVADFPELAALEAEGLTRRAGRRIESTDDGLERSDAIGPWLYSVAVTARMQESRVT